MKKGTVLATAVLALPVCPLAQQQQINFLGF